jgi:hypothetical protein
MNSKDNQNNMSEDKRIEWDIRVKKTKYILVKYPVILGIFCAFFLLKWNSSVNHKYDLENQHASLVQSHQDVRDMVEFSRNNVELSIFAALVSALDGQSTPNYASDMKALEKKMHAISIQYRETERAGNFYLILAAICAGLGIFQFVKQQKTSITS